jgi:hypothetical protein
VTVVATGYGEQRARRAARDEMGAAGLRPPLREPAGEPRISRTSAPVGARGGARSSDAFDVPEFIPRR